MYSTFILLADADRSRMENQLQTAKKYPPCKPFHFPFTTNLVYTFFRFPLSLGPQ